MSRIELTDTGVTAIMKMSDGNPGAVACLADLFKHEGEIDPDSALKPFGSILALDDMGIYGSSIYVLWSDQCQKSTRSLVMLLRACQLGFIDRETIQRVAADQSRSELLDLESLDKQVCERLEGFQKPSHEEVAS